MISTISVNTGEKGQRTGSPLGVLLMMTIMMFFSPGPCPGQTGTLTGMDEEDFIHKYRSANKTFETTCKKHLLKGNLLKAEKGLLRCPNIMPGHVGSLFYLSQVLYQKLAEKNGVTVNTQLKDKILPALDRPVPGEVREEAMPDGVARFTVTVGSAPRTFEENTYIAFNPQTRDAVIIDPGARDKRIETFIQSRGLKIRRILNTHGHHDHIGANRHYAGLYGVEITAAEADAPFYRGKNSVNRPTRFLHGEGPLDIPGLEITVFFTPGHSPGSVCYLVAGHLFSGDTLFKEGVGRTWGKNEEEKQEKMERQISHIKSKLLTLPGTVRVFPGHGPHTVIQWEKTNNPFL